MGHTLWCVTVFVFIAYLMTLFFIMSDLVRDRKLHGWVKALWLVFIIFLPFLTALVYLIVRGGGMGERATKRADDTREVTAAYIRGVTGGAAADIAQAKQLLDDGASTAEEYAILKQKALQS